MNGPPVEVRLPRRANDAATARALWEASEKFTGIIYELGAPLRRSASPPAVTEIRGTILRINSVF
jgi:hypothetical protein